MLVDLGRNDLGSVCEYGSVSVDELLQIERYSHVMHIVSNIVGRLRPDCDALDLFRAGFPAGTVTGTPKIRAMQLIDGLEPVTRGFYAGSIGRCRSAVISTRASRCAAFTCGRQAWWQASAGIVADSEPRPSTTKCCTRRASRGPCSGPGSDADRVLFIDNFDSFSYNVVHLLHRAGLAPDMLLNDDPRLEPALLDVRCAGRRSGARASRSTAADASTCCARRSSAAAGHGSLSGAAGDRRGARARGDARAAADARQDLADRTRRQRALRWFPSPLTATRYHSLCVEPANVPGACASRHAATTAWCKASRIASVRCMGVQFHPESVLSEHGRRSWRTFSRCSLRFAAERLRRK